MGAGRAEPPSGDGTGGSGILYGRTGIRGLIALYGDSLRRLAGSARLRHSLGGWLLLGLLVVEAFTLTVVALHGGGAAVTWALAGLAWWAIVGWVMLGGAMLLHTPDGTLIERYGVPNGLTVIRAWACLPLLLCAAWPLPHNLSLILWAGVGGAVGMLDAVDGFIARHFGPITELGKALDPAGDAFFFSVAAVGCTLLGIITPWLMWLLLVRYLGPLAATPIVFLARRRPELVHTTWGRRNTMLTGVVLFVCLMVRLFGGPVATTALVLGLVLLVPTTALHFVALGERAYHAPVVRESLRERINRRMEERASRRQ